MKFSALVFALLLQAALISGQQTITNILNVDPNTCANYLAPQGNGFSILQQFLNEAAEMSRSGLNMLQTARAGGPDSLPAQAYLTSFFKTGINDNTNVQTIQSKKSCRSSSSSADRTNNPETILTSK
jgi:hypothetical protein